MFDKLIVRSDQPHNPDTPLDLGGLVEGALFYGQTETTLDVSNIKQIVRNWSAEGLLELHDSGLLTFKWQQNLAGIRTENTGSTHERHSPVLVELSTPAGASVGPERQIGRAMYEVIGKHGRARRLTTQICRRLVVERLDRDFPARIRSDLLDSAVIEHSVKGILQLLTPEFPTRDLRFEIEETADGLRVMSNIDFLALTAAYKARLQSEGAAITPATLLARFLSVRQLIEEAARSGADMAADPVDSAIASIRVEGILARTVKNAEQVRRFQDFVLDDARAVREAVNSGRVTLPEIVQLLAKAQKFRDWLDAKDPDVDVVKEYFRAVTEASWVDKLPPKAARWVIFSGVGLVLDASGAGGVGTALGLATGAADTFLLDRMLRGWKPDQFVEDSLKPFVARK
jgi:hypothetical protein